MESALAKENAPGSPREAIGILGESPQTALILGNAYLDGRLTRSDLPGVRASIRKFDSEAHRALSAKIDAAVEAGQAKISVEEIKSRLDHGADPWAGLDIYRREVAPAASPATRSRAWAARSAPTSRRLGRALGRQDDRVDPGALEGDQGKGTSRSGSPSRMAGS